jgi:hypothetical protein
MEGFVQFVVSAVGLLFSLGLLFVFINAIAKAAAKTVLGPIHEKLDRLLAMQEESHRVPKA